MNFIIINSVLGIIAMLFGTVEGLKQNQKPLYIGITLTLISFGVAFVHFFDMPLFGDMVMSDLTFGKFQWLFLMTMELCLLIFLLLNGQDILRISTHAYEQLALLFFIFSGCALLISYNNLLMLFLGIEIVSIPLYILTGIERKNLKGNEAALKYFLMGAFSTCILLMGIALVYGATGSFDLIALATSTTQSKNILLIAGLMFIIVSLSFKVSAAPFHFWTPDVYEGAPTLYTSFMATIVKSFFILCFLRLLNFEWGVAQQILYKQVLAIIACTFIVGNITAVFQKGIKRLLAYSSIAQVGFMLFAIFGIKQYAYEGLYLYTVSYTLASMSIFAIISHTGIESIDDLKGLSHKNPILAFALTVYLLSLAGIPLTAGFLSKYFMILTALKSPFHFSIIIILVLSAGVSMFYYLRLIQAAFIQVEDTTQSPSITFTTSHAFHSLLIFTALVLILLGIQPFYLLQWLNF